MLQLKPGIRLRKKGDLRDFGCGMVVGARQDFHAQPPLGFTENSQNKTKYPRGVVVWMKMPC